MAAVQPGIAFRHSAFDGMKHVYGPAKTPGTLILFSLFVSASVSLLSVDMISQVLAALGTGTSGDTRPIAVAIKVLVVLFAALIGLNQSWRRREEWEIAWLVGGGPGHVVVSSIAESLGRCVVALASAIVGVGVAALVFKLLIASVLTVNLAIAWGSISVILAIAAAAVTIAAFMTSGWITFRQGIP